LCFCEAEHTLGSCTPPDTPHLELTLIVCTSRHIIQTSEPTIYAALSYLWGEDLGTKLESYGQFSPLIPLVVKDAISVTKELGFRYLWVDRYCIPQDEGATKDFLLKTKALTYSQSTLTIIAGAGEDPSYGLP
ncbi:HET-domain-containing protein, partial [Cadophora sp. DSE1049]